MSKFLKAILFRVFICIVASLFAWYHVQAKAEYQPVVFSLWIDTDFKEAEVAAIYQAAQTWVSATNGRIQFVFTSKQVEYDPFNGLANGEIWRADKNDPTLIIFELLNVGTSVIGYAPPGGHIILVPNRTDSESFKAIAAHELGHHIGLQHTPAIMDSLPSKPCITKYDLDQFCDVYGCRNMELDTSPQCIIAK